MLHAAASLALHTATTQLPRAHPTPTATPRPQVNHNGTGLRVMTGPNSSAGFAGEEADIIGDDSPFGGYVLPSSPTGEAPRPRCAARAAACCRQACLLRRQRQTCCLQPRRLAPAPITRWPVGGAAVHALFPLTPPAPHAHDSPPRFQPAPAPCSAGVRRGKRPQQPAVAARAGPRAGGRQRLRPDEHAQRGAPLTKRHAACPASGSAISTLPSRRHESATLHFFCRWTSPIPRACLIFSLSQ